MHSKKQRTERNKMKIQSDLFDRFVAFAGRNLEPKAEVPHLSAGGPIKTQEGDFMVVSIVHDHGDNQTIVTLQDKASFDEARRF